jgi:hypothetical protein
MFTWLKKLFGGGTVPEVINEVMKEEPKAEVVVEEPKAESVAKAPKKTTTKKKSSKKGTGTCDFTKLTKAQLLAEAKHRGVKANASLSKAEILERLTNA